MPKDKQPLRFKLEKYIEDFPSQSLSTDGKVLYCNACNKSISSEQRFLISQHISTAKHKENITRKNTFKQQFFSDAMASVSQSCTFSKELCYAMICADIPLWKLNNPTYKSFLEKYSGKRIPDESTLRKKYVSGIYEDCLAKIREEIQDGPIWAAIDETTDSQGRCIGNVIIGRLFEDRPSKSYLLACEELPKCNHQTSAKLFNDAMSILWPGGVKHEQVFLLVTDAAPYMVKAADALNVLYTKMIHITCLAHGVNRLAECIRFQFKNVDSLVSKVKKIFLKAPSRISKFKELYPGIPLPPEPVLTRWGTWLTAVEYYADHFNEIRTIISQLDDDSASILASKELLEDESLGNDLIYIKSNYCFLSHKLQALENPSTSLNKNLKIIEEIEKKVSEVEGPAAEVAKQKLKYVLEKNKGFNTLKKINNMLCGSFEGTADVAYTIPELCMFKYAPVTSCDVERSFSQYKAIFRPNRQSFNFEHLKKHVIIYCNQFNTANVDKGS